MRNTVTVSQEFPTWAAAYEARERLAEDGLDQHGIEQIEIERYAGKFELLVRTNEHHRDEIEHLLRSAGTMINPPAEDRGWSAARGRGAAGGRVAAKPLLLLGVAGAAALAAYALLGRREPSRPRAEAARAPVRETGAVPMFTLEAGGAAVAVTKGNESEARAIFEGAAFRDKLRALESDGRPLWDGAAPVTVRPASAAEIRAFVQYAETLGFEDEEEGEIVLYLRPIDAPGEFDETQDG